MKDEEKHEALVHLRDLLNQTGPTTLRECGVPESHIQELKSEGLIQLAVNPSIEDNLDKYFVHEIKPAAVSWILQYERKKAAHAETLGGTFSSTWRSKLVEMLWGLVGLVAGAILGWHLHKYFGTD